MPVWCILFNSLKEKVTMKMTHEFQNDTVVFDMSSICFNDSMHSSWHGLHKFMQILMIHFIPELLNVPQSIFCASTEARKSFCLLQGLNGNWIVWSKLFVLINSIQLLITVGSKHCTFSHVSPFKYTIQHNLSGILFRRFIAICFCTSDVR